MNGLKRSTSAVLVTVILSLSAASAAAARDAGRAPKGEPTACNSNVIAIEDFGPASLYPSSIPVAGLTGSVTGVRVTLSGFAHEWPDDVNALLVGPQGQRVVLMQDVGSDFVVSDVSLTFADTAAGTLPDDGQIVSGTYRPTAGTTAGGGQQGGVYPAPAPAAPYAAALSAFNGTDPNGLWQLFVYDDTAEFEGVIAGGWCLEITTASGCNSAPITVPESGAASPYPSAVTVAGLGTTIAKVTVTLNGLTHDWPDDLNVLLVGPQGQRVVLVQDAGGLFDVSDVSLTFDDAAARFLPDSAEITSGAYRPTVGTSPPDETTGGLYPPPAPAGPYAATLMAFNGTNPNGTWQLFVYDDTGDFGGAIAGGWCLTIETGGVSPRDTVGLYVPASGAFFLRNAHSSGPADFTFVFGAGGAVAVTGDWNGDGTDTPGLYVPSTGTFFLKNTNMSGPADVTFFFGPPSSSLVPIAGDWDGDGDDTIGLYDPMAGAFFLKNANANGAADVTFFFGPPSSTLAPVAGDWDGDGDDTIGLYDPAAGAFFLRNSNANGAADLTFFFGAAGAGLRAIAGDWNGDGIDSIGLYTPSTGAFFLKDANANGAADYAFFFGIGENTPLAGNWDGN